MTVIETLFPFGGFVLAAGRNDQCLLFVAGGCFNRDGNFPGRTKRGQNEET